MTPICKREAADDSHAHAHRECTNTYDERSELNPIATSLEPGSLGVLSDGSPARGAATIVRCGSIATVVGGVAHTPQTKMATRQIRCR